MPPLRTAASAPAWSATAPSAGAARRLLRLRDADGRELSAEHRLSWRRLEPELAPGVHTVEVSALLTPEQAGEWPFALGGFGRMSVSVDGPVLDGFFPRDVSPALRIGRATSRQGGPSSSWHGGRSLPAPAGPRSSRPRRRNPTHPAALTASVEAALVVVGTTEHDRPRSARSPLLVPGCATRRPSPCVPPLVGPGRAPLPPRGPPPPDRELG